MKPFQLIPEPDNKIPMENYMKNNFIFLGVKSPSRKEQSKDLIKQSRYMTSKERFILVMDLYSKTEREYQYIATDICQVNASKMNYDELIAYLPLIEEKAWWDSVDAWRKVFGDYIKKHPDEKEKVFELFFKHSNFWMRRISIILQLTEKEKTDKTMLTKAILFDLETDEFFIQKAIGWSLRQYSKVNPKWVKSFVIEHNLSALAEREALKQIRKDEVVI